MKTAFVEGSQCNPATEIFEPLVHLASKKSATDIHIHERGSPQVFFRARRLLQTADYWTGFTDNLGCLIFEGGFVKLREVLIDQAAIRKGADSVVYRYKSSQIRVTLIEDKEMGASLFIRMQKKDPPRLATILAKAPELLKLIENPDGLVLVCGPIGSGKTTLAASIAYHWAMAGRHVVTQEDPIEYLLKPVRGRVTQLEVRLGDDEESAQALRSLNRKVMRTDLNARFVGESRDGLGMSMSISAAGAAEPIVTTMQAGGISDAILRAVNLAAEYSTPELARLSLAACLHVVLFVNLSFDSNGNAVPVIMALPATNPTVRRMISEARPESLPKSILTYMEDARDPGLIGKRRAVELAIELGAKREDVLQALSSVNALSL